MEHTFRVVCLLTLVATICEASLDSCSSRADGKSICVEKDDQAALLQAHMRVALNPSSGDSENDLMPGDQSELDEEYELQKSRGASPPSSIVSQCCEIVEKYTLVKLYGTTIMAWGNTPGDKKKFWAANNCARETGGKMCENCPGIFKKNEERRVACCKLVPYWKEKGHYMIPPSMEWLPQVAKDGKERYFNNNNCYFFAGGPVAARCGEKFEKAVADCCKYVIEYGVKPRKRFGLDSYGSAPANKKSDIYVYWNNNHCTDRVGGVGAPRCKSSPSPGSPTHPTADPAPTQHPTHSPPSPGRHGKGRKGKAGTHHHR